jgi:hypothetical protein
MAADAKLAFFDRIDWSKPDKIHDDGRRSYFVDCGREVHPRSALDFKMPAPVVGKKFRTKAENRARNEGDVERVIDDSGEGIELDPSQDGSGGDTGSNDERPAGELPNNIVISGIASSTSVDFFGTEMSLRALKGMAVQMMSGEGAAVGIPYVPAHGRGFDPMEWDDVIGRTTNAEVVPVDGVDNAHSDVDPQFVLRVTVKLFPEEEAAQKLLKRLARGEIIGQSIGGWFTRLEIVENEQGDIERIIVHAVELDHLAVTRAPANPDSIGITQLRSALSSARGNLPSKLDERHVIAVAETDNTVVYQFMKAGADAENLDPEEIIDGAVIVEAPEDDDGMDEEEAAQDEAESVGDTPETKEEETEGRTRFERAVVPFGDLPLADGDTEWSWTASEQDSVLGDPPDWDRYRSVHVWYDADNTEVKSGYKLPIGRDFDGTLRAVPRAIYAAMAAVNGARGGVDIPEDEREGAYSHLAKYYSKMDEEPPAFRSRENIEREAVRAANEGRQYDLDLWLSALSEDAEDAADIDAWLLRFHLSHHGAPRRDGAESDTLGSVDARRSALGGDHPTNPPAAADADGTSEERTMPIEIDDLRSLLDEKLAPLYERIEAVEQRTEPHNPEPPSPAPEQRSAAPDEPDYTAEIERLKAERDAERAKAELAHQRAAELLMSGSMRVGRSSASLTVPSGPAASGVFDAVIERSKDAAPMTAAVATRGKKLIEGPLGELNRHATRSELEGMLMGLCNAAEHDGTITPPGQRPAWN